MAYSNRWPLILVPVAFAAIALLATPTVVRADTADASALAYPLDSLSRTISPRGKMRCPKLEMLRHKGTHLRYHKPVYIYAGFKERLERFEAIVSDVAFETYGRRPRRIVHVGTYNCRRIRRIPALLSEHALGNAIDIEAFDFGPARGRDERTASPHRRLRRGFKVRIDKHWDQARGPGASHAAFLHKLTERLLEDDVFRVLLGPAFPGHQDHFHFDLAPYRLVSL
ncbi:MAG: extensin family protein [Myxococcales bacterium]|nr:extensin family protein [Myxococcales bacterium]